ncbi:MAG: serine hydrolase [Gammaproteobacteria bacterium]|nr:serine hydrolase [Gammaproteobacteria bacterium]
MKFTRFALFFLSVQFAASHLHAADYFPPAGQWQAVSPQSLGVDADKLAAAVAYAIASENKAAKDQTLVQATTFGAREPFDQIIGPMSVRAAANGMIIYRGKVIAEWGDTHKVDMTHSISKTFLTAVTGLAIDDGLIHNSNDLVAAYLPSDSQLFSSEHNRQIRWEHLLRQTSDWQGTLWGKPDWADRPEGEAKDWPNRPLHQPGSRYKYNDVRVNLLALATTYVWRKPLPVVLNERIMQPIGASSSWRWYGYDNSWIELDGQKIQSVSGGGHWGGGMFLNAWDLARFGYLFLRDGQWQGQQLISRDFIAKASTGGSAKADYGYANWFLNPKRKALPAAPETAITFQGAGRNIVYLDQQHDVLMVVRWIGNGDELNQLVAKLLTALPASH